MRLSIVNSLSRIQLQMASGTFLVDEHIPDVLVFPSGTDLHDNILYKEGKIILQDKVRSSTLVSTQRNCHSNLVPLITSL